MYRTSSQTQRSLEDLRLGRKGWLKKPNNSMGVFTRFFLATVFKCLFCFVFVVASVENAEKQLGAAFREDAAIPVRFDRP